MFYTIGEMARIMQVQPSTLRYYDKEGLLPFVERSEGGIRMFKESDYEGLCIITCLKNSGMPLKDIKEFMNMVQQGDASIEQRLALIKKQQAAMEEQMENLQKIMRILDYKVWYYQTAKDAGTTAVPREMEEDEVPAGLREVRKQLRDMHYRPEELLTKEQ